MDRRTSPSGWAASQAHDALLLLGQVINRVRERLISLTPQLVMAVFRTLPDSLDYINLVFHHHGVRTKLQLSLLLISTLQGVPIKTHFQNHHPGPTIHPSPQAGSKQPRGSLEVSACRMMIMKVRFFLGHPVYYYPILTKIWATEFPLCIGRTGQGNLVLIRHVNFTMPKGLHQIATFFLHAPPPFHPRS